MLSVLAALVVLAQGEVASPLPPIPVVRPNWTNRPSAEDLARLYPPRATRYSTEGRATMLCTATAEGQLANCRIVSEFPVGEGFDQATLSLARLFRLEAVDGDGQPVTGREIRIPVRWQLPGTPFPHMQKLETAMACYGQVAHRAQQDPALAGAWNAVAFWSMEVAVATAGAGIRPRAYGHALADSQDRAEAGTLRPPKDAELDACLAKVPKG